MFQSFSLLDKLDKRLLLTFSSGSDVEEMTKGSNVTIQIGVYIGSDHSSGDLFIPDTAELTSEIELLIKKYNGKKKKGFWIIPRIMDQNESEILNSILSIPSMVLNGITLRNGVYTAEFLFNSNELEKVSSLILQIQSKTDRLGVEYLGDSNGYLKTLRASDIHKDLYVAEIDRILTEETLKKEIVRGADTWIRIMKNPYGSKILKAVYFPFTHNEKSEVISENTYFEDFIDNEYVHKMNQNYIDFNIITHSRIQIVYGKYYKALIFVPKMFSLEWSDIWKKTTDSLTGWTQTFSYFSDLETWIENSKKKSHWDIVHEL